MKTGERDKQRIGGNVFMKIEDSAGDDSFPPVDRWKWLISSLFIHEHLLHSYYSSFTRLSLFIAHLVVTDGVVMTAHKKGYSLNIFHVESITLQWKYSFYHALVQKKMWMKSKISSIYEEIFQIWSFQQMLWCIFCNNLNFHIFLWVLEMKNSPILWSFPFNLILNPRNKSSQKSTTHELQKSLTINILWKHIHSHKFISSSQNAINVT